MGGRGPLGPAYHGHWLLQPPLFLLPEGSSGGATSVTIDSQFSHVRIHAHIHPPFHSVLLCASPGRHSFVHRTAYADTSVICRFQNVHGELMWPPKTKSDLLHSYLVGPVLRPCMRAPPPVRCMDPWHKCAWPATCHARTPPIANQPHDTKLMSAVWGRYSSNEATKASSHLLGCLGPQRWTP